MADPRIYIVILPVVMYYCETLSFALREEDCLNVLKNGNSMREFVLIGWRLGIEKAS